jgi:cytochrome c-type biogenesis protein CcmE
MKLSHIILLIMAAVGIGVVVSLYGDTTSYVGFEGAKEIAKDEPGKQVHVLCNLDETKAVEYNAQVDANYLVFYAVDSLNTTSKVVYHHPKPAEMGKNGSKILLIGHYEQDHFMADDIKSKCPSKYEEAPE